jgi:predicted small secreted protein
MMKKRTLWVAALVLLLALVLASCGDGGQGGGGGSQTTADKKATTETTTAHKKAPPAGVVKSYSNLSRNHTKEPVDYPQSPPVGGPHNPIWQNCGFYSKPVSNEYAVHSMEHGAVWITHSPDLPKDQVEKIKSLTQKSYVLASPYPGLPAPVVASAWGKQLRLNSTSDPRLEQFVSTYSQGPQNPEPGAPCTGGVGSPE